MSSQYIFTMNRLSRLHPPNKTVLDNITLYWLTNTLLEELSNAQMIAIARSAQSLH